MEGGKPPPMSGGDDDKQHHQQVKATKKSDKTSDNSVHHLEKNKEIEGKGAGEIQRVEVGKERVDPVPTGFADKTTPQRTLKKDPMEAMAAISARAAGRRTIVRPGKDRARSPGPKNIPRATTKPMKSAWATALAEVRSSGQRLEGTQEASTPLPLLEDQIQYAVHYQCAATPANTRRDGDQRETTPLEDEVIFLWTTKKIFLSKPPAFLGETHTLKERCLLADGTARVEVVHSAPNRRRPTSSKLMVSLLQRLSCCE
jgi:hypothetical protein